MTRRGTRRRLLGWVVLPLLAGSVAAGAFAATLTLAPVEIEPLETPAAPVAAEPRVVESRLAHPGTLTVTIERGPQMTVTGPQGLVTAVAATVGSSLENGDLVARIGNTWSVAMLSEAPQWRSLSTGAVGPDVESLQLFLRAVVAPDLEATGKYGRKTRNAVRELERLVGVPKPTGVSEPRFYAWTAATEFEVGSLAVAVGTPLSGDGLVLAEARPLVTAQQIDVSAVPVPDGDYIMRLESGETLDLEHDPELRASPAALARLPEVAEALKGLTSGAAAKVELPGSVQLRAPMEVVEAPPSAVSQGRDGSMCVWVEDGEGWEAVGVDVVAIAPNGVPQLRPLESGPRRVLVNPARFLEDPRCP